VLLIQTSSVDELSVQFMIWMNDQLKQHIEREAAENPPPRLWRRMASVVAASMTAVAVWALNLVDF
jgi:hypothetical protein